MYSNSQCFCEINNYCPFSEKWVFLFVCSKVVGWWYFCQYFKYLSNNICWLFTNELKEFGKHLSLNLQNNLLLRILKIKGTIDCHFLSQDLYHTVLYKIVWVRNWNSQSHNEVFSYFIVIIVLCLSSQKIESYYDLI